MLQVLCARWAASAEPSTCASVPAGSGAGSPSSSSSDSASATAGTSALRDYNLNVDTDILWLLDPMTFTDSQYIHMTSLNKI